MVSTEVRRILRCLLEYPPRSWLPRFVAFVSFCSRLQPITSAVSLSALANDGAWCRPHPGTEGNEGNKENCKGYLCAAPRCLFMYSLSVPTRFPSPEAIRVLFCPARGVAAPGQPWCAVSWIAAGCTKRGTPMDWMNEIASKCVLDQACASLCDRRLDYYHNMRSGMGAGRTLGPSTFPGFRDWVALNVRAVGGPLLLLTLPDPPDLAYRQVLHNPQIRRVGPAHHRGPSFSACDLPAWTAVRYPVVDHPEIGFVLHKHLRI